MRLISLGCRAAVAPQDEPLTMSSREIADLVGKDHRHIRRDFGLMFEALNISPEGYAQIWTHPQNGQKYEEFFLPRDLTETLFTGYSTPLRHKVVLRLGELQAEKAMVGSRFGPRSPGHSFWPLNWKSSGQL